MAKRKKNYLNNRDMLLEIHRSKNSFCEFTSPEYEDYDIIIEDGDVNKIFDEEIIRSAKQNQASRITKNDYEEALRNQSSDSEVKLRPSDYKVNPDNISKYELVFRVYTYEHIPESDRKKNPKRTADFHVKLNFFPFKHYIIDKETNEPVEVGRSHCNNGEFSKDGGCVTNKLAHMYMLLVERYSQRANWRTYTYLDEMKGHALFQLSSMGLKFNEARSQNPFSYFSKIIENSFTKIFNVEKRNQNIRDDILIEQGLDPSFSKQVEYEEYLRKLREDAKGE